MNMQQELAAERKAKEDLLLRVSFLEKEMKIIADEIVVIQKCVVQLINATRKLV